MKQLLFIFIGLAAVACSENDLSETTNSSENGVETKSATSSEATLIDPCSIITVDKLCAVFMVNDPSTVEMYSREKYADTKQCQFLWTESQTSVKSSQLLVNITSKIDESNPTKYSRMLEIDLEKGLLGSQQQIIKPESVSGLGKGAYFWAQLDEEKVQKIKFQIDEKYMVELMYNSNFGVPHTDVRQKLTELAKVILN